MTARQPIVLDTSVLAELMKPQPDMAVLRWTNAQPIGVLAVTAISLAELTYAMLRMSELARGIDLRQALNEFVHDDLANRILPFDDLAADYFAAFAWKREQAGDPIDAAEAQIAAICVANGVTLATKDPAGYLELGVDAVDPWTAPPPIPVEVPVVVATPELDRHGKPIPPRRPGAALGGVGPSRPPRKRKPRRATIEKAKKEAAARAKKKPPKAAPPTAAASTPSGAGSAPDGGDRGPGRRTADEHQLRLRRAAAERLQRHVNPRAVPAQPPAAKAPPRATRPARSAGEPPPVAPGQRGARLLGPLVDAEGRPVERTADGKVRRRTGKASGSTAPSAKGAPTTPNPAKAKRAATPSSPPAKKDPPTEYWPPTPPDPATLNHPPTTFKASEPPKPSPPPKGWVAPRVSDKPKPTPKPKQSSDSDTDT